VKSGLIFACDIAIAAHSALCGRARFSCHQLDIAHRQTGNFTIYDPIAGDPEVSFWIGELIR